MYCSRILSRQRNIFFHCARAEVIQQLRAVRRKKFHTEGFARTDVLIEAMKKGERIFVPGILIAERPVAGSVMPEQHDVGIEDLGEAFHAGHGIEIVDEIGRSRARKRKDDEMLALRGHRWNVQKLMAVLGREVAMHPRDAAASHRLEQTLHSWYPHNEHFQERPDGHWDVTFGLHNHARDLEPRCDARRDRRHDRHAGIRPARFPLGELRGRGRHR